VDTSSDLGEISKYVLGANHGPWSDLGAGNIEMAQESGVTFLRWPGGNWGDRNDIRTSYIDNYMGIARTIIRAEPSITVRLLGGTPEQAADLVRYVNIDRQYGVKYWSIGNEPDLYIVEDPTWTPEYYAKRWREFAEAMKAVDPNIIFCRPAGWFRSP
jgi:alpha-L-arabinofuranosidase